MNRIPKGDIITQQFRVKQSGALLDFLLANNIRKSKNATQSVLRRRLITVNGKLVTQFDHPLKAGDKVAVMKTDQAKKVKRLKGMSIVYEDENIIVIDKESGLLSVATDKEKIKTAQVTLAEHIAKKSQNSHLFVLHRLDREVSGLMIFGKDLDTQGKFHRNWNFMVPIYNYLAVIEGTLPEQSGSLKSWLTENKNYQVFSSSFDNGGMEAVTHYKVIKAAEHYSLVEFKQETRRRNQIRAQMQQLRHPIVGDKKYGAASNPVKRMALHASEMTIKHPVTGQLMNFKSPMPKIVMKLLTTNI